MCKGWSAISSRYILIAVYPFSEDDSFALWHIQYQFSAVSGSPQVSERGGRRDSWAVVGTRAGDRERQSQICNERERVKYTHYIVSMDACSWRMRERERERERDRKRGDIHPNLSSFGGKVSAAVM